MGSRGFLSRRQRRWAWAGFVTTALQAPLAAHLVNDASWLFSVVVAGMVGAILTADEASRRPAGTRRGLVRLSSPVGDAVRSRRPLP